MSKVFILSWDQLGLESVIDATSIDQAEMWDILKQQVPDYQKGRNYQLNDIVNALMMRARFNSHRHYEIYSVIVDDEITEEDVRQLFEQDPQGSADLIRTRGKKIYSDREDSSSIKIR